MADLFDKTRTFTRAKEAIEMGLYPFFQALSQSEGVTAVFKGKDVVMIGSNNYLGLTTDPRVKQAAIDAVEKFGTSCTGSRFLNGTLEFHLELDRRLAKFVGKEAALVFPTGYQTNVGTISAIVQKGDYVIVDKDDHASIVDGCLMCRGEMRRFVHNDPDSLETTLRKIPADAGKLVVVDGVYSMGGDIAPLPHIVEVCKKYGARIMVDDAHSLGVLGGGRGTAAHFGLTDDVDLIMGTFSKSFASIGGFIAGSADMMHFIQHHARALMFSASLPAPNAAAVLAALDIIEIGAGARPAPVGQRELYARRAAPPGLRYRPQHHADYPAGHPRRISHRAGLARPDRRGLLHQSRCAAGRSAQYEPAAHQLHGDAPPGTPGSRAEGAGNCWS